LEECVNQEFDISRGAIRHTKAYGVVHYLDDSLFDNPSFPVKKLHCRTLSHLFSRVDALEDTKQNMHDVIKPPNIIWFKVSRDYIKLPTFKKYQNTQK
jgi:hypothetical protein